MKWEKAPERNIEILALVTRVVPEAERKLVFGYPAYFLNGHMFAGTHQSDIILRLSDEDRADFLERTGAGLFYPMPGKPMKEYVVVPPAVYESEADFGQWLTRSRDYVLTLAPKEKKKGRG